MYIDESYYNKLLLEAKSPEEIKRILTVRFVQNGGVPEDVLDSVLSIDPTKKKSYTSWLLNLWPTERNLILESLENGKIRLLFHYFKSRNNEGLNLTAVSSLREAINMLPEIDTVLEKIGNGPENDFDIVYDTPEWKIAVPHNYPASEKLGKGCRWCTAGAFNNGPSWFDKYTRTGRNGDGAGTGPLWINFDYSQRQEGIDHKEYPYTRYQFLFEWDNYHGEFMNYLDQRIEPSRISSMPDAVRDFYVSQNPRYESAIMGDVAARRREQRKAEYERRRTEDGVTLKTFDDGIRLILLQEYNENYTLEENSQYKLYTSEDINDPISYDYEFSKVANTSMMETNFPFITLKAIDGIKVFVFKRINGFIILDESNASIENHGDYVIAKVKTENGPEIFFATDIDNNFVSIPFTLNCLGKRRKVVGAIRNSNIERGGQSCLEIKLDNGFHVLFTKATANGSYNLLTTNVPLGDCFTLEGNSIVCKYGNVNLRSAEQLTVYELINERFAIIKKNFRNQVQFNVFDCVSRSYITNNWFESLNYLSDDFLLGDITDPNYCNTESVIINLKNKKITKFENVRRVRGQRYNSYIEGYILADSVERGIKTRIPFSLSRISFYPEGPEQERALEMFKGTGASDISESFKNFYKRMINK